MTLNEESGRRAVAGLRGNIVPRGSGAVRQKSMEFPVRGIHWSSLARLSGYSCSSLASFLGLSLRQAQRHFKDSCKDKMHEWIFVCRMRDAAHLLASPLRLYEVAALLGYQTSSHFSKDFKSYYGVKPSEFSVNPANRLASEVFLLHYLELLRDVDRSCSAMDKIEARLPASLPADA